MKMIRRPDYVNAILPFVDAPLVKILSGVRRCGKSTILEMMKEALLNRGVKAENHHWQKLRFHRIWRGLSGKGYVC